MNMEKESQREAYGVTLQEIGKDDRIVVLDADLSSSTHTYMFSKLYPERFFNMGIQEQNEMGVAAGLARSGKIVYASTFAVFATGRAYDVIRQSIAYTNLNVKIVATHGGLTVGEDGATHQALEDIGIMSGLPNMRVIVPGDAPETKRVIREIMDIEGPFYVRLSREKVPSLLKEFGFELGKAIVMKEGSDLTIISTGITLSIAMEASSKLKDMGIDSSVIHMPSIKPIDRDIIIKYSRLTGKIITIEEHSIYNGLGSRVSEIVAEDGSARVRRIGVNDTFGESGPGWELLKKYGISSDHIIEESLKLIKR